MEKIILSLNKLTIFWMLSFMLIYGILMAEYFYILNGKINLQLNSSSVNLSYLKLFNNLNFGLVIISSFVVWLLSSILFHLFAILVGGTSTYKALLKSSSVCYIIPALCFIGAIFILDNTKFPSSNIQDFLLSDKSMISINLLINIGYIFYFLLLLPILKYLYQINWLKAIGAIAIPIGSIYLLGKFFADYVL